MLTMIDVVALVYYVTCMLVSYLLWHMDNRLFVSLVERRHWTLCVVSIVGGMCGMWLVVRHPLQCLAFLVIAMIAGGYMGYRTFVGCRNQDVSLEALLDAKIAECDATKRSMANVGAGLNLEALEALKELNRKNAQ